MIFFDLAAVREEGFPPIADASWGGAETGRTLLTGETEFPGATGWGAEAITEVSEYVRSQNGTCGTKRMRAPTRPAFAPWDDSI